VSGKIKVAIYGGCDDPDPIECEIDEAIFEKYQKLAQRAGCSVEEMMTRVLCLVTSSITARDGEKAAFKKLPIRLRKLRSPKR